MSSSVVSVNHYALLGNDPELDPDLNGPPNKPVEIKSKSLGRAGKRDAGDENPRARGAALGNGNTIAPKARDDGIREDRHANKARAADPSKGYGARDRSSRGGPRGGRGAPRSNRDDRQNKTGHQEHEKQAGHGWGQNTADAEFADEREGLADARKDEEADGIVADDTNPVDENGAEAEPEDKTVSYDQYLKDQAEKRARELGPLAARPANDSSSKANYPEGKKFSREGANEDLIPAKEKHHRVRDRDDKEQKFTPFNVDLAWVEQPQIGGRGGSGGDRGRGGRGRGEGGFRGGDRGGRGGERGRGGGRGRGDGYRGDRADRGGPRGPRGGRGQAPNVGNSNDFPALG